jgi:hypothetical protein
MKGTPGTAERATPWTWIGDRAPGPIATHSAYLVITGVWPLLHYRSFEAVTGPKTDAWLVRTVGALSVGFGVALAVSEHRRSLGLSAIATAAFVGAEVVPAVRGRIRRVYLLDAAFQGVVTSLAAYQAAREAA